METLGQEITPIDSAERRPARSRGIISNFVRQVIDEPITTLGTAFAAAAFFVANPEVVGLPKNIPTPANTGPPDTWGIVTWVLLTGAVNFFFAKWGSLIARRRLFSGYFVAPIFGFIAITIACYLASKYLASFPLEHHFKKAEFTYQDDASWNTWIGLELVFFSFLVSAFWCMTVFALYGSEIIDYFERNDTLSSNDFGAIFSIGVGILLVMGIFCWIIAHAIIVGTVPIVEAVPKITPT